jgi:SsrA-binding protein
MVNIDMKEATVNRKAYFDYEIMETYEAGIELFGFEVKAIKTGRLNLTGSFAVIKDKEAWLLNANIPAYQPKNAPKNYDPIRTRRLLLHKKELKELIGASAQKGLTIVPLKMYNKKGLIKILIGLSRHKKQKDKRETIKKRDIEREVRRELKRE